MTHADFVAQSHSSLVTQFDEYMTNICADDGELIVNISTDAIQLLNFDITELHYEEYIRFVNYIAKTAKTRYGVKPCAPKFDAESIKACMN